MERLARRETLVAVSLGALMVFDVVIAVWAFGLPDLWFQLFHTDPAPSSEAVVLLRRCGANWTAFALFQGIAWWHWKSQPVWLAVVAGVRLSDIFTDPVYALVAGDGTWIATLGLPVVGVMNLAFGWFFLTAYFVHREST
jgi:hypothetical protein